MTEVAEARERFLKLRSNVSVLKDGLARMRGQLTSQSTNLHADVAQTESRLDTYLTKADRALQLRDYRQAQQYLDLADHEA